jgi:hypothetical protein
MDALVVVTSVASVLLMYFGTTNSSTVVWIRALRALRALRPLRAASRLQGVRVVVITMTKV